MDSVATLLPAAILLFASAMVLLGFLRWRRKKKALRDMLRERRESFEKFCERWNSHNQN